MTMRRARREELDRTGGPAPPALPAPSIRGASGFTLLEVVIVVMLISFALAISYPALSRGGASLRLRASARDVLNTLRFARERAITEQRVTRIVVDREAGQLHLTDEFGAPEKSYSLKTGLRFEQLVAGDQRVDEGPLVVRFLPNGSGESAKIALQSETGAIIWIVTDPITGGARIQLRAEEQQ